jgi:hypothetical protein
MITAFLVFELSALIAMLWAVGFKPTKGVLGLALFVTVLNAVFVYWWMPVPILAQLVLPVAVETAVVISVSLGIKLTGQVFGKQGARRVVNQAKGRGSALLIPVLAIAILVGAAVSQALTVRPMYRSVQATVKKEAPLTTDEQPIALSTKASENMMKKAFSQVPDSSMYRLGDLSAQYINGKPYYVAPVEFNGFWSWLTNQKLPGYFIISATDINDTAHFVKKQLDYSETSWFNHNIARKIYMQNAKYSQVGEPILEIDEDGNAYWVQSLLTVRWAGQLMYNNIHVSLTDADSGKTTVYKTADLPKWVDVAVSPEAATRMNRTYGNPYPFNFQHRNQIKPTENGSEAGVTPVFNADGSIAYFDDFTTVSSNADSDKGYAMVNSRTGKLTFYTGKNVGIMDSDGAIRVAKQLHPQNKWHGSNPVIMNIDGTPTWVISMMDQNERFREYAYIKGADQNVIGEGDNAAEALSAYRNALATSVETASSNDDTVKNVTVTGTVERVNPAAQINGDQVVIFKLNGDNTLYTMNPTKDQSVLLLAAGDDVSLVVKHVAKAEVSNVITFTNNTLK